jgi:hypothetical protein
MERRQAGTGFLEGTRAGASGHYNCYRGINVYVSKRMRPHLNLLGQLPTRDKLDADKKTNQLFFTRFVEEYNRQDVQFYDQLHHNLDWTAQKPKPSVFAAITWKKAAESFSSLSSDYDAAFSMWKQSGKHDQNIPKPFKDFTRNRTILYMHLSIFEFKDLLSKVRSEYQSPKTIP